MIELHRFEWLMKDLEQYFTDMAKTPEKRDYLMEQYYEAFKYSTDKLLGRTVKHLIRNRKWKSFPMIGEIKETLEDISREVHEVTTGDITEELPCPNDCSYGYILEKYEWDNREYERAVFCNCEQGEKRKKGWMTYLKKEWEG